MTEVLRVIKGTSESLQTSNNWDYAMATSRITSIQHTLEEWRASTEQSDGYFARAWNRTLIILKPYKIKPILPRLTKKKRAELNMTSDDPQQYYRLELANPFLDHIRDELEDCFNSRSRLLAQMAFLVPSIILRDRANMPNAADFRDVLRFYESDMPSPENFEAEYRNWVNTWLTNEKFKGAIPVPSSVSAAIKNCPRTMYPNIWELLQIFGVIPVSVASNERMFSTLKRVKTRLRTTMGEERLTGLTLISTHRTRRIDPREIVRKFFSRYPHRPITGNYVRCPPRQVLPTGRKLYGELSQKKDGTMVDETVNATSAILLLDFEFDDTEADAEAARAVAQSLHEADQAELDQGHIDLSDDIKEDESKLTYEQLLPPRAVDVRTCEAFYRTLPAFPLPYDRPTTPPTGHRARIIDFYGHDVVPRQLRDWLTAVGVEVQDSISTGQIDGAACGFIAAEVISYMHNIENMTIDGLSDAQISQANTPLAVAAGRRFFNLPSSSGHWLSQTEAYRLIASRISRSLRETYRLVVVDNTEHFIRSVFPEHSLQLVATDGTRSYILNTDSTGRGLHWFVVAVTFAPQEPRTQKR